MTFPASQPEQRFRALNDQRIERLRKVLDADACRAFDALPDRLLEPAGEDVLGIYLMGSAGTFGQGPDSDLDVWVVCGNNADHTRLDHQLQRETDRCREHGLDLRAFLVNPHELRAGKRTALAGDDCGSTQDRLLLDEFYRTAVLLRGAAPLWWLISADDERRYDELAPALSSPDYLDLGGIPEIPEDEFLGATLWHLHKAIEAPHKSLLKLLLLEAYALDENEPLALHFKRLVHNPNTDLTRIDPYLLMYERIEQHLQRRHDAARLHLARVCVLRKAESFGASAWQRAEAARLRERWGWDPDDPPTSPGIEGLLREHAEIARQLDAGHTLLRQWTDSTPARFAADRDLQLLEAELAAHTLEWPGKVPRLNSSLRKTLATSALTLSRSPRAEASSEDDFDRVAFDWVMRTDGGAELIRHGSLSHLVAWCCINGLWPSVTPGDIDGSTLSLLGDRLSELARTSRPEAEALLQPPKPCRDMLFVLDHQAWVIDRVTLNSWGEVSTRCLHGLTDLGSLLPEIDPQRIEIHSGRHTAAAQALGELLAHQQPATVPQLRVIVESERTLLCLDPDGVERVREFRSLPALLEHLRGRPLPAELRGAGPLLAPARALLAAAHASRAPNGRAHVLLLPNDERHADDGLLIVDRDGALAWAPLPRRPLAHQQDALRLFLANAGRRLRIETRAWIWRNALLPLAGRVYLPERVRVLHREGGGLDLECAESAFRSIDRDPQAAAAARTRILNLRRPLDRARLRASGDAVEDYPITVTDVATPDPTRSRLRDLLATKLQVETLLNRTGS